MIKLSPLDRLRLQRGTEHLTSLGDRAVAEFLAEVGDRTGEMPCILLLLGEYQRRLTPAMMAATGGNRFPPRALQAVPREGRPALDPARRQA
jgi:hypothetical protein